jgi:hypothetical protein
VLLQYYRAQQHLCWRTQNLGSTTTWERVKYTNNSDYTITITDITADREKLPKILEFSHAYSSVISPSDIIWFSFYDGTNGFQNVVPSHNPNNSSDKGTFKLRISNFSTE